VAEGAAVDRMTAARLGAPVIVDVCIDVNDLDRMTVFWESIMGYERSFEAPGHSYLIDPSGRGPHVYLQQVPEVRQGKNNLHLDIVVPALDVAVQSAESLGATRVRAERTIYTSYVVLADPEGNLFCLVDLATWQETRPPWWQH
jgi:predicted enzyme related to lactoylglutathione lyase